MLQASWKHEYITRKKHRRDCFIYVVKNVIEVKMANA
jgi:hypothetical protein